MKSKLLLLSALLCISAQLLAQPQHYNNKTVTATNSIPLTTSAATNRAQMLMLNSSFPTAVSGPITAIYFQTAAASGTNYTINNLSISMGQTNINSFSTVGYIGGLTSVYTATSTPVTILPGGWMKINLQTPFAYDNTKNMIVDVSSSGPTISIATTFGSNCRMYGSTTAASNYDNILYTLGFDMSVPPVTRYNNDITFSGITGPTGIFCPQNQNLNIRVNNVGKNQVSTLKIGWVLDGVQQPDIIYGGLVDTFSGAGTNVLNLTSIALVSFSTINQHTFKFYTYLPNGVADGNSSNDTQIITLSSVPPLQITPTGYTNYSGYIALCNGGPVNVTLTPSLGGTAYTWKLGNNTVQVYNTGLPYTATQYGTYFVTATISGCSISASVKIDSFKMSKPKLSPFPTAIVCTGDSTAINVTNWQQNTTFQWQNATGIISGATNHTYQARSSGAYSVTAGLYDCTNTSDTVYVTEKPVPTPTITDVTHYLFTDTGMAGYQWYILTDTTPAAIAGDTFLVCMPKKVGNYIVMTYNGGCWGTSHPYYVDSMALGIYETYLAEHIKIYPNPAKNQLYVDAPNNASISVAGMDGRLLMQQPVSNTAVDISKLSEGVYIIRVMDKNNVILKTEKLIKQGQ